MHERRQSARWQLGFQARIKFEGAEVPTNCTINDINFKGMRVSLKAKLPKDAFIKFNIILEEGFVSDIIEVWVAWHRTVDGINIYGLYFSKIKDSDKEAIYKFVHKKFPERIKESWRGDINKTKGGGVMEGARLEDNRIFERFPAKIGLTFLDVNSNREAKARSCDISAKGIGFITKERLSPYSLLEMWLEIPDKGEPLYTRGDVVWSKSSGSDEYRVGVNLERADLMGLSRVLRTI